MEGRRSPLDTDIAARRIWTCISDEAAPRQFRNKPQRGIGERKKGWGLWVYLCSTRRNRCGQTSGAPLETGYAWKSVRAYLTRGLRRFRSPARKTAWCGSRRRAGWYVITPPRTMQRASNAPSRQRRSNSPLLRLSSRPPTQDWARSKRLRSRFCRAATRSRQPAAARPRGAAAPARFQARPCRDFGTGNPIPHKASQASWLDRPTSSPSKLPSASPSMARPKWACSSSMAASVTARRIS